MNPFRTADAVGDVHNGPRQRMLPVRGRIRRHFSPEAIAGTDPDAAEVIGERDIIADRKADAAR